MWIRDCLILLLGGVLACACSSEEANAIRNEGVAFSETDIPEDERKIPIGVMAFKSCADDPTTPADESLFKSIRTCTGTRISPTHVMYADHCRSPITDPQDILVWNDYEEMRALKPTRDFQCQDPAPYREGVSSVPVTAIYAPPLLPGSGSSSPLWITGKDIAVLSTDGLDDDIPIARLGNPAELPLGEDVFLIGLGTDDCYDEASGIPYYGSPRDLAFGKAVFDAAFSDEFDVSVETGTPNAMGLIQTRTSFPCNGDSGAGILRRQEESVEVDGVVTNRDYFEVFGPLHSGRPRFFSAPNTNESIVRAVTDYHRIDAEPSCELLRHVFQDGAAFRPDNLDTICPAPAVPGE